MGAPAAAEIALDGVVDGFVIDRPMSARAALEPLAEAFGFDALAGGGRLRFAMRRPGEARALTADDLVPDRDGALLRRTRAQEAELPQTVTLSFIDGDDAYASASETARRPYGGSRREAGADLAAVLQRAVAAGLAERILHEAWTGRERASFTVRPTLVALEPGDTVVLPGDPRRRWRIERVRDARAREIEAVAIAPPPTASPGTPPAPRASASVAAGLTARPFVRVVDWPAGRGDVLQSAAVTATPWPGGCTLWRSADGIDFESFADVPAPATAGITLTPLPPGPLWRWDRATVLDMRLSADTLASGGPLAALAGQSAVAVQGPEGVWEVLAFAQAELIGAKTVRLSTLLRGLGGSEPAARRGVPEGAPVVVVDGALATLAQGVSALGLAWRWRVTPRGAGVGDPAATPFDALPGGTHCARWPPSASRRGAGRRA